MKKPCNIIILLFLVALVLLVSLEARAEVFSAQDRRIGAFEAEFIASRNMKSDKMFMPNGALTDLSGQNVPLKTLQGKITVLSYWASWCGPCVTELPTLEKLRSLRPDIHVLAVSLDTQKTAEEVKAFLVQQGLPADFPVYFDTTGEVKELLVTRGLPTSYVIGKKGQVLYQLVGSTDWSSKTSLSFFDFLGVLPVSKKANKP